MTLVLQSQAQLALPMPRQRIKVRRENAELHQAVVKLRRAGHRVYCHGKHHKVDGRRLSSRQLAFAVEFLVNEVIGA